MLLKKIENFIARSESDYEQLYKNSIENPSEFWNKIAETFYWRKKWDKTLEYDFNKPEFKWFLNGKLNITENCLDRHLLNDPEKTAILFETNDPTQESEKISYK